MCRCCYPLIGLWRFPIQKFHWSLDDIWAWKHFFPLFHCSGGSIRLTHKIQNSCDLFLRALCCREILCFLSLYSYSCWKKVQQNIYLDELGTRMHFAPNVTAQSWYWAILRGFSRCLGANSFQLYRNALWHSDRQMELFKILISLA